MPNRLAAENKEMLQQYMDQIDDAIALIMGSVSNIINPTKKSKQLWKNQYK